MATIKIPPVLRASVGGEKEVRIQREAGKAEQVYARENAGLKSGGEEWTPMPRVDGLKLKGRYSYKSAPGPGVPFNVWVIERKRGLDVPLEKRIPHPAYHFDVLVRHLPPSMPQAQRGG